MCWFRKPNTALEATPVSIAPVPAAAAARFSFIVMHLRRYRGVSLL
jgi:hypothetical protein